MHDATPGTGTWLRAVVQGHFNYYAVPGNLDSLGSSGNGCLACGRAFSAVAVKSVG